MHRIRPAMLLAGLLPALALVGSAGMIAATLQAGGSAGSAGQARRPQASAAAFRVLASAHYGAAGNASGFSVIVTTRLGTAWALGGTNPGGSSTPVAEQWNGRALVPARLPSGLTGFLTDASAPGPHDIWAASRYGGYVLHWDGISWRLSRRWPRRDITGVTALARRNVWVFGTPVNGLTGTGTWHFNGRSWTQDRAGVARQVYRASAVSRRDIWAIATNRGRFFVVRYNGRTWRRVSSGQVLSGVQVSDIRAISSRDVWVVGNSVTSSGAVRLVLVHYNGKHWVRIPTELHAWAGRLAPATHGGVLVTATPADADAAGLILRASADGWGHEVLVHSGLGCGVSDAALDRRTRTVLASGGILTRRGGSAVVWAFPARRVPHRADDDDV